jgi:hypothetical protein
MLTVIDYFTPLTKQQKHVLGYMPLKSSPDMEQAQP